MRTHGKQDKLTITDTLRVQKGAKIVAVDSDGTEFTVDTDELAKLDGTARVETLAAASTLEAADSGKTLFLALAGGFTTTLPAPAAGLNFKFIVATSPTTAYIIVTNGGADIIIGGINELEVDTADDGPYDANADTLNLVANVAVIGDWVSFVSDGTSWYITGQTNADGGVTTSTA